MQGQIDRRTFLGGAAGLSVLAALDLAGCAPGSTSRPARRRHRSAPPWDVPAAAWTRPIGDYPPGASGTIPPLEANAAPQTRTKRGIPVGGIGTGSFMFNLAGGFGPWHFDIGGDDSPGSRWGHEDNGGHEERILPGAAFHLALLQGDHHDVVTLATEDVLPAWKPLALGQGSYHALFPKAWFVYDGLLVPVVLQQLTPYVARDERWTSMPFGLFRIAVRNPTRRPVTAAAMLTFPNAIYRRDTAYAYTRTGLRSRVDHDRGVTAVRLQAEHPDNVPETQRTEWVIATTGRASYTQDWAADGDGHDVLDVFASRGGLPNAPLDTRGRSLAGAVASRVTIPPDGSAVLPFAVAWDFPVVQFRNPRDGTQWRKRYTEFFGGGYRGADIASHALRHAGELEAGIDRWWAPVAHDDDYPLWLRRAALNELYYDVFGGSFWENGCITKPKRYGARRGQHLSSVLETNVYRDYGTLDVRHYECRHRLVLFPSMERDVLLAWADLVNDTPDGHTPHDAGSPVLDPWFVYGQYTSTAPGQAPADPRWKDLPARFVQQCHAYWRSTGDNAFLAEAYPAAARTMAHLLGADTDGDGIPENEGNDTTYDAMGLRGASTIVAGLTIGALEAMADMSRALGRRDAARHFTARAERARASAEQNLWLAERGYYRTDTAGPYTRSIMSDALNGQRYAEVHGLPDVLDRGRMTSHLREVYRRTVVPFANGRYGAVNAVAEDGTKLPNLMAQGVWPGGTYFTAALMYRAGKVARDRALRDAALATAEAVYRCTYEDESMAFWFDTPAIWYPQQPTMYRAQENMRPRAVWELLLEVKDPYRRP